MLVSIIIPTHSRNHHLERAIRSVFNQTFTDYEIVVVDDTLETNKISKNYPTVRFLHIPQTPYPAVSRNAGIKASRGKYIAFLDDDDAWFPDKLYRQVNILENYPEIGLVCTNGIEGKDLYIKRKIINKFNMFPQEIMGDFVVTSSCVIRKELLQKTGLYNELPLCEDYDLALRFAAVSKIYYDPTPTFRYTVWGDSIQNRSSGSFTPYHKCVIEALNNTLRFLKTNNIKNPYASLLISYRIWVEYIIVGWNIIKDRIRGI